MNIKDNRGMSLIELIVVFAIIAVLIATSAFSIRLLFGTDAKQLANKLNAELNEVKTGAMSRFDETLTIKYCKASEGKQYTSDGYYSVNELWTIRNNMADPTQPVEYSIGTEAIRLGSSRVDIVAVVDGAEYTLGKTGDGSDVTVMIRYNRSTGAMKDCYIMPKGDPTSKTATGLVSKLKISSGVRAYEIVFDSSTGRHTFVD